MEDFKTKIHRGEIIVSSTNGGRSANLNHVRFTLLICMYNVQQC